MPNLADHLAQARRNEALSRQLEGSHPDWAITLLFYSALHYVEAYFFVYYTPPEPQHYATHATRDRGVVSRLPRMQPAYRALKTRSEHARYQCVAFTTADVRQCRRQYLDPIKQFVLATLPSQAIPAPVTPNSTRKRITNWLRSCLKSRR